MELEEYMKTCMTKEDALSFLKTKGELVENYTMIDLEGKSECYHQWSLDETNFQEAKKALAMSARDHNCRYVTRVGTECVLERVIKVSGVGLIPKKGEEILNPVGKV